MSVSINAKLAAFASSLYVGVNDAEGEKIRTSVNNLSTRLIASFKGDIRNVEKFGSYTRGTILPRIYDPYSDVDLMIVWNRDDLNVTPRTLRNYLITFSETYYSRSISYRDSPVVVLELQHINYDLVPVIKVSSFYSQNTYIPLNDSQWQTTDPLGFNATLSSSNVKYGYIVKPIIRLMKAWNAKVGFPISPYKLEQEVASMSFLGDNVQSGFIYAAQKLLIYGKGYSQNTINKIQALQSNIERVDEALQTDRPLTAVGWLAHILPINKDSF
ncbi:SMODS domain-containing nucleotidyltransferase [Spirosoma sordidisoli]|uniref:Nucleotidyltransferase n=1 Tax=Spirosoma sordidisoli TaxID=2502893 RepID=A0A4Q2UY91_9BACT|nr:nucleotidyltransferase domain-containing protein [Spirosoma sordidisoli]RYC72049.1 nucleotidyltransferase [Spirosoma sordidisoli]